MYTRNSELSNKIWDLLQHIINYPLHNHMVTVMCKLLVALWISKSMCDDMCFFIEFLYTPFSCYSHNIKSFIEKHFFTLYHIFLCLYLFFALCSFKYPGVDILLEQKFKKTWRWLEDSCQKPSQSLQQIINFYWNLYGVFLKNFKKIPSSFMNVLYLLLKVMSLYTINKKTAGFISQRTVFWRKVFSRPRKGTKMFQFFFVVGLPMSSTFYVNKYINKTTFVSNMWLEGVSMYNFFKPCFVAVFLMILYFFSSIFFFKVQLLKQLSIWFIIGLAVFWLFSGFNFFVKRYQFSKFTAQVQSFWKSTSMYFWLIETSLILLFSYYYLNSSQEPMYMYDYSSLNHDFLASLDSVVTSVIVSSFMFYLMYFCLLSINSSSWSQLILFMLVMSGLMFYSFFSETLQFYSIISLFMENVWILNENTGMWALEESESSYSTKDQYVLVFLLLKYWHFMYIFLNWVFFLIKSYEKKKMTYVLFCGNFQNVSFMSGLTWISYLELLKYYSKPFFDQTYSWFFIISDNKILFKLFNEISLVILSLFSFESNLYNLVIMNKSLLNWGVDSAAMWKFIV